MNSFGVVIVDYNSFEMTLRYIEKFFLRNFSNLNIVVVNNGEPIYSSDKDYVTIFDENQDIDIYTKVLLVNSGGNLGYAKGNNLGVKILTKYFNHDFTLITNNDIEFYDKGNVCKRMLECFSINEHIGVVGPNVLELDGTRQNPFRYLSIWRRLVIPYSIYPLFILFRMLSRKFRVFFSERIMQPKSGYVYKVAGCFFMIRNSHFIEAGGFDPNTFLYSEEQILTERLKKNEKSVYYYHDSQVIHAHSKTISKFLSEKKQFQMIVRNNLYYYEKYINVSKITIVLATIATTIYKYSFLYLKSWWYRVFK